MVAVETGTRYTGAFDGQAEEVSRVRREVAGYLGQCPVADDIVFIANELAANAVLHSASGGKSFTVRCEAFRDYVWIECEDLGGPWHCPRPDDRPHGLDIIEALAGPNNWGTDTTGNGGRITWARLDLPPDEGLA
jgi:anti-sigma regulatory factor (Ser/Thr protein kinase)